jgi:hypothetical protein
MRASSKSGDSEGSAERHPRGSSRVGLVIKVVALAILVIGVTSCVYAMSRYG